MLQPLQLKEVSLRYADDIAELRDFLSKAGLPVATAEAISATSARLQNDRSFHRDLSSNIWVLIHQHSGKINFSDLLGVLALAAAGPSFAAEANEDDAHVLLRFLMETRQSLDSKAETKGPAATPQPVVPTIAVAETVVARSAPTLFQPVTTEEQQSVYGAPRKDVEQETEGGNSKRPLLWGSIAACLLAALLIGLWLHNRASSGTASAPITPAPVGTPAPMAAPEVSATPAPLPATEAPAVEEPRPVEKTRAGHQAVPAHSSKNASRAVREVYKPAAVATPPAPIKAPPAPAPTMMATAPQPMRATPPAAAPATQTIAKPAAKTGPSSVPANTLSSRLDSPSLPSYTEANIDSWKHPQLKRRNPGGELIDPSSAANATAQGTVRPTSLGIMAGNLMYSPVPPYPAAASASHTQGTVTLKAEVDRNGNVGSARVVSGPPLLRDAALDAVQHWRYRPYMSKGKPIPMTDTVVMEFQLP